MSLGCILWVYNQIQAAYTQKCTLAEYKPKYMQVECTLKCMREGYMRLMNLMVCMRVVYRLMYTGLVDRPMYIQEAHMMGYKLMYTLEGYRRKYKQEVYRHLMILKECMLVGCKPRYTPEGYRPMYSQQVGCRRTYMALANEPKCKAAEYMPNCILLVCTEEGYKLKCTGEEYTLR